MVAVAVVLHSLVGGMSWAVAFALGAIVSPPDSVAATQIAGKLGLPRRLVTILGRRGPDERRHRPDRLPGGGGRGGHQPSPWPTWPGRFVFAVVVGVAIGIAVGWIGCSHAPLHRDTGHREHHAVDPPVRRLPPGRQAGRVGGAGRGGRRALLRPLRLGVADRRGPAAAAGDLGPDRLPADRHVLPPRRPRAPADPRQPGQPRVGLAGHRVARPWSAW